MSNRHELDLDHVRGHFPGLDDWAFFENAGGTHVPREVIDRIRAQLAESRVQPGAAFPDSATAAERHAEAQRAIAAMINAEADEVVLGPSTTMNMYVLAHALRPWFDAGDEIVVTDLDHEANSGAWRRLADAGVTVREWRVNRDTADLDVADLEALLGERTRLVCFPHCSNITGSVNDAAAIIRLAHDAGALACVDAVAYAPHGPIDVKALDADFYAFSTYKLFGPHIGVLYGKREHLVRAKGQNHYFIAEDDVPAKLMLGGVNHDITPGLAGIVAYFDALHAHHVPGSNAGLHDRVAEVFALAAAHEQRLAARFVEFLDSKPGVRIVGRATADHDRRAPTFSFVVDGRDAGEIAEAVLADRVAIRSGDFYAARLIDALGLRPRGGVVRASMVHYNTEAEVDRLIRALDDAI